MKFEDTSQNLRARLRFVQILVVTMLSLLSVRLYLLQVVRGERYADIAQNQRRRRLPIPAPRGVIFDRNRQVLNQTGWYTKVLSPKVPDQIMVNSMSPRADDFQIDFRWAK